VVHQHKHIKADVVRVSLQLNSLLLCIIKIFDIFDNILKIQK